MMNRDIVIIRSTSIMYSSLLEFSNNSGGENISQKFSS